jgi:hypothetical protein
MLVSDAAQAQCAGRFICYDNIFLPSDGTLSFASPLYDSFTSGLDPFSQTIGEADFRFQGAGPVSITLLSNNADNTPGEVLDSSSFQASPPPDDPSSLYVQEFYPLLPWSLSPDTRYWIELSSLSDLAWSYASAPGLGTADEFWADSSGVFLNGSGIGPFQMDLGTGTAGLIPEPATWFLMAVGFAGLAMLRLRMRLTSA